jgi:hypothetical protein
VITLSSNKIGKTCCKNCGQGKPCADKPVWRRRPRFDRNWTTTPSGLLLPQPGLLRATPKLQAMLFPGQHEFNQRLAAGFPAQALFDMSCHPCCGESCSCPDPPLTVFFSRTTTPTCALLELAPTLISFDRENCGAGDLYQLQVTCLGAGDIGQDVDLDMEVCCRDNGDWRANFRWTSDGSTYNIFPGTILDFQCEPFRLEVEFTIFLPTGCGCGGGNITLVALWEE